MKRFHRFFDNLDPHNNTSHRWVVVLISMSPLWIPTVIGLLWSLWEI